MNDNQKNHIEYAAIIEQIRQKQGWDDATMLSFAMEFIKEVLNGDLLYGFTVKLRRIQSEENAATNAPEVG